MLYLINIYERILDTDIQCSRKKNFEWECTKNFVTNHT